MSTVLESVSKSLQINNVIAVTSTVSTGRGTTEKVKRTWRGKRGESERKRIHINVSI